MSFHILKIMLVSRIFLLTILVFYISNSSYLIISQTLLTAKWGLMLLLLFYFFLKKEVKNEIEYELPNIIYYIFFFIFIQAGAVTYLSNVTGNGIFKLVGFGVVIFIASKLSNHFMREGNRNNYYKVMLIVSQLVVYSSVIFYVLGLNLGRVGEGGGRFSGWVDNANTLALMFIPLFPFILLASFRSRKLSVGSPRVILVLMIFIIILTGTRSVAIGITVATIVMLFFHKGSTAKAVVLIFLSLLIIYMLGLELQDVLSQFKSFKRDENLLLSGREEVWGLAIYLIQQNPYLGFGFDTESFLIEQYSHMLNNHQGATFHSSYLSYIVHLGFIGAIPLLFFALLLFVSIFKIKNDSNDPQIMDIKYISASIVLSSLVHAIFETWLFSPGNLAMLLFWLAAFNLIAVKKKYERHL